MHRTSARAATAFLSILFLGAALPAQTPDSPSTPVAVSKVRIVRLSEMKGIVQVDRGAGSGYETAMTNLPIVEGTWLQTGQGVAEVEFEDNSTVRLVPGSIVKFGELDRLATGATVSSIDVLKGTVYASLVKEKGANQFNLVFGQQKLALAPGTHVRLEMEPNDAQVAVLDGTVSVNGPAGAIEVSHKKTVTLALAGNSEPTVEKKIAEEPTDEWDQNSTSYHARVATVSALNSTPYSYGLNDLSYYGNFMDAGGCGMMWRPYFASAAWDPFSNGAYAWYPGAGYSWVSPYPWAWTPYHSGSWSYCQGMGWGWQPGGSWYGLNNATATGPVGVRTTGTTGRLPRPPGPPLRGQPTLVEVNLKPLVASQLSSANAFEFRKDSAGMGVPRNELGKLDKLSREADQHGMARAEVYMTVPSSAMEHGRLAPSAGATMSIHRGSAPAYAGGSPSGSRGGNSGSSSQASSMPAATSTSMSSAAHGSTSSGGGARGH